MPASRSRRTDRVAALILREVTRIVREEVRDPRIGFVTFTGADVTPDLSTGRIFLSVMGTEAEKRESVAGLRSAAAFIRGQLWDVLDLKTVPELTFHLDRTLEQASRIEALLDRIQDERPEHATADDDRGPAEAAESSPPEEDSQGTPGADPGELGAGGAVDGETRG